MRQANSNNYWLGWLHETALQWHVAERNEQVYVK